MLEISLVNRVLIRNKRAAMSVDKIAGRQWDENLLEQT